MNKLVKKIFIAFTSFLLVFSILVLGILWNFSNNIPDYKFLKNYKPPVSSKVYSGNGELVADFSKEKRIFIPYSSIPKNIIMAFLSAEDKNFFLTLVLMQKVLLGLLSIISKMYLLQKD